MKAVERIRQLEAELGAFNQDYTIDYIYSPSGNVDKVVMTVGTFVTTTTFTYNTDGNVVTEEKIYGKRKVTKTYTYTNGNVTKVTVVNSAITP